MSAAGRECSGCRFFDADESECHAAPPSIDERGDAEWPPVMLDDWCGHHEPVSLADSAAELVESTGLSRGQARGLALDLVDRVRRMGGTP